MRKIKDILRYRFEAGLSLRGIALALNIGYGTVADYLKRAEAAGLGWPLPPDLQERDLGRLLFPTQARTGQRRFAEPDFTQVSQELKGKGVAKQLLWQECRQQYPDDGYSYAQFCRRYLDHVDDDDQIKKRVLDAETRRKTQVPSKRRRRKHDAKE